VTNQASTKMIKAWYLAFIHHTTLWFGTDWNDEADLLTQMPYNVGTYPAFDIQLLSHIQ